MCIENASIVIDDAVLILRMIKIMISRVQQSIQEDNSDNQWKRPARDSNACAERLAAKHSSNQ